MEIVDKYIPREYLALKINYCRQRLEELPKSTMMECKIGGATRKIIKADNHRYCIDTPAGANALKLLQERKELSAQLQIYETIWDINFKGEPLPECKPCKLNRCLYINPKQPVIMDKAFFDSLKNDDIKASIIDLLRKEILRFTIQKWVYHLNTNLLYTYPA